MRHKLLRVLIGSILTLVSISIIAATIQWIFGIGNELQSVTTFVMAVMSPMVAGAFLVVWGWPVHFALSKYERTEVWWYLAAGFIPAPFFVFVFKPFGHDEFIDMVFQSLYLGAIAVVGAAIFWFYVVKMPHNKSPQPTASGGG